MNFYQDYLDSKIDKIIFKFLKSIKTYNKLLSFFLTNLYKTKHNSHAKHVTLSYTVLLTRAPPFFHDEDHAKLCAGTFYAA